MKSTSRPSISDFITEIPKGNRVMLAKAITLVESRKPEDQAAASELIEAVLPHTGNSIRIGITGVPGVGKSTFIEALGKYITSQSKKIAVLAVDPSSTKTKGSILGDKTRMEELSREPHAFIRATATGAALGGVADRTREAILLCEAAGFEIILVETVGVGQSETAVRSMVDFFLLLMLAGAGDELQGIKKGIMEMADGLLITKADGENVKKSSQAKADFQHALQLFSPPESGWKPRVLTCSALEKQGIKETWQMITDYTAFIKANEYFSGNRSAQNLVWFHENIQHLLRHELVRSKAMAAKIQNLEEAIKAHQVLPSRAAREIIQAFIRNL